MLLTEKDAAGKWCPHARYSATNEPAANRWAMVADEPKELHSNPPPCRCIASACMQWRWAPHPDGRGAWPPVGYCGLAGRPDKDA